MFYTVVISILSQTLFAITRIWDYRRGFPGRAVWSQLQFHTYCLPKNKERFFTSSELCIFLPREGLIQLLAWCPLRCLVVSKTGSRQEARTRTCVLEKQPQAKWDTHQVTLTNELTSWIEPATSTLQCRNKICSFSGSSFVLKINPWLISAVLCPEGLGWFVIFFPNMALSQCDISP